MAWTDALEQIESAIADFEKVPNFNVEFGFGYALGLISGAQRAEAITWEQYENYHSRIAARHKEMIAVCQRTGRDNTILVGDIP